jgi:spore coat protein SA
MRVLVISPGVLPVPPVMGGAVENLIARLHQGLGDIFEFHYVSVATPPQFQRPDPRFSNAIIHAIDSINPLEDFNAGNYFELQESAKWTAYTEHSVAVAKSIRPDVIHIHNEVRLAPHLAKVAPEARIVVHVNDEVVTRLDERRLREVRDCVDLILSCSNYIAAQISSNFRAHRVTPPKMSTFYNFVDETEFDPARIDPAGVDALREKYGLGDAPTVAFVGRLIEQKGPQTVIRAFKHLRRVRGPAKLIFVGAPWYSRDEHTAWVQYLKGELAGFEDDVVFTGYVPHWEIPLYYALSDIMTVPSIWDDPSPFVAYESQAMERPVLGSTRGGIPEIVRDRDTGRCIDVYNTPLFGEILAGWIDNPAEAKAIGHRGRAHVREQFSLTGATEQMRAIYEELSLR